MALKVCGGCRRHVRDEEVCPFCGAAVRTTVHVWKAAVLTAMVPLGLAACYGAPPTDERRPSSPEEDAKAEPAAEPSTPQTPEAKPEETPDDPPTPEDSPQPEDPPPPQDSAASDDPAGDSSDPDGTDTPIVEKPRPPKKYGAPPRPRPKYGGPPRPLDPPSKPPPTPDE